MSDLGQMIGYAVAAQIFAIVLAVAVVVGGLGFALGWFLHG